MRRHWGIEISSHHVKDAVFAEDASTVHPCTRQGHGRLRNPAIGGLRLPGAEDISRRVRQQS